MKIRRVVTGHNGEGRAIFERDDILEPGWLGTVVWSTGEMPVDNTDPVDGAERDKAIIVANGTLLRIGVIAPGQSSTMHRTQSLDYGLVLDGECDIELDDGAVTTLRKGDVIIQRGTIHNWVNRSSFPCTMAWLLVAAEPLVVNGKPLEPTDH